MTSALIPAGLLLLALAAVQLRVVRYVTYPPALFCGVWGVALLWVAQSADAYLPMRDATIAVYVAGAVAFSIGGALGWGPSRERDSVPDAGRSPPAQTVPLLTLVLCVLAPLYVIAVFAYVGRASPAEFLYALRVRSLDAMVRGGLGVIANVVPFAMMVALLAVAVPATTTLARVSRGLAVGLGLGLAVLTGGSAAPLALILGSMAIASARITRPPVLRLAVGLVAVLAVFSAMSVLVRKGTAAPEATLEDNVAAVAENLRHYAIGGVVAFDRLVDDPRAVPHNGGAMRTAKEIANGFGARYEIPPLHMQFSTIGNGVDTNVYTIYFAYLPFVGIAAMLAIFALLGAISARVHRHAVRGSTAALLFHGILAGAAVQSVFSEYYLMNLNFLGKLAVFVLAVQFVSLLSGARGRAVPQLLERRT